MTGHMLRDRAATLGYEAGWTLSRRLPEPLVSAAFDRIGTVATRRAGPGVQQLRRNLARARPDLDASGLDALTAEAMQSYLRYWREAFRLPTWTSDDVEARMRTTNSDVLFDGLASGRGVIAVLGHFGNWDHAGAWITGRGFPLTTVAERLRPESLFDKFVRYRESLGMRVLPLGGGAEVTSALQQHLREGSLVALLADRDLTSGGIDVDLLGEPARMPAGPALLAERTGAAFVPVISYYDGDATHLDFTAPLVSTKRTLRARVNDLTQQWAVIVGEAARNHARDWHMLQPVWTADLNRAQPQPPHEATTRGARP
jgi:KDO2-lipid IV(A) lauroyltransferase